VSDANLKLSGAAIRTFVKIADRWEVEFEERARLLQVSVPVLEGWCADTQSAQLETSQLERISFLLGIFIALHTMYGGQALADDWPKKQNTDFGERRPLDRMFDGIDGIREVRDYIYHAAYVIW